MAGLHREDAYLQHTAADVAPVVLPAVSPQSLLPVLRPYLKAEAKTKWQNEAVQLAFNLVWLYWVSRKCIDLVRVSLV